MAQTQTAVLNDREPDRPVIPPPSANTSPLPSSPNNRDTIPPWRSGAPRTLILCLDGVGDRDDHSILSNVLLFNSLLRREDASEQLAFYHDGSGDPSLLTSFAYAISKALHELIAFNLVLHILRGYKFLMDNYQPGDKICMFGFSDGAHAARAFAGMLHRVGLLFRGNDHLMREAYVLYRGSDERKRAEFKKTFARSVEIEFMGVWDAVASVGLFPHRLPYATSSPNIRTFRHAVSLDERRALFRPSHYHQPSESEPKTDAKEVWFAGCHKDVGVSFVHADVKHSLARIPLRWMIQECFRMNTGIRFLKARLVKDGFDPDVFYPIPQPVSTYSSTGEASQEAQEVLSPIYDQLAHGPWWWIYELLPVEQQKQLPNGEWKKCTSVNLGRGRTIPAGTGELLVHRSVKTRMEHSGYKPRAENWAEQQPIYVD